MDTKMAYCNCCGRAFSMRQGSQLILEDYVRIDKVWGYFSDKDGLRQKMLVCEECFGKWIGTFSIPPEEIQQQELI